VGKRVLTASPSLLGLRERVTEPPGLPCFSLLSLTDWIALFLVIEKEEEWQTERDSEVTWSKLSIV
jgi:hypothetical protein